RRLLLRQEAGTLDVALERSGQARGLVRLPGQPGEAGEDPLHGLVPPAMAALPRWLVLPADAALRRPMVVPAAAAERLHDVLGFEIDRQTPFAAAGDARTASWKPSWWWCQRWCSTPRCRGWAGRLRVWPAWTWTMPRASRW